jgi:hypothetical protein
VESFNGKLRDELLDREVFERLLEAKVLIELWRVEYNTIRPHSSLGYRPPAPEVRPLQSRLPSEGDPMEPNREAALIPAGAAEVIRCTRRSLAHIGTAESPIEIRSLNGLPRFGADALESALMPSATS